ncbi:MAG: efflux RND transporter periplasmic adaptor subunit [Spirochaetia bacterium]|nr:efflux RND transporter periplasmic adaptor subunit [Spirochaetia bacterium]MDD7269916.1 efflux RND transporter periplasmic adaptor subunit [Treponema sp.]MDY4985048.1 efflux RND transporter periplasmic adaptor subunit [Treponema sp.]
MSEIKKMNKKVVTAIIVVAAISFTVLCLIGFKFSKKKKGGFGGRGGFGGGATVTTVRTIDAVPSTLKDYVFTNGEIQTQTAIEVFPAIGGTVVEMKVSLGSPVKKGDVIAYVDPSDAGSYYVKSPVVAPIDGSIISSPVKTGQKVNVSSVVTKIGDIDNLQINAKIPERFVADLKIGQKAEISLEAYPEVIFNAHVVRISPVVDPATRTKEIILNFDKTDSRVNSGMFAKVKLYTNEYAGEITISQDALVNNNDEYYLYVVNEDGETVSKRKVTLGKNVDGKYQILDGVGVGETVVIEGMLTLANGSKIKDIGKAAEASTEIKEEK